MNIRISRTIAAVEPSVTLALTAKANELKAKGIDVCAFTAGEPDFDTPVHIRESVAKTVLAGGKVCRYTTESGMPELKDAVREKFKRDNGLDYTPDRIVVSVGAKQVLFNAVAALLDPGDEILVPAPYWVSYPEMAHAVGANPVLLDCRRNANFAPTGAQVKAAITPRTRAMFLCSPSNPTGGVMSRAQLEDVYAALDGTDIVVLSDEIYEYLVYDGATHVSPASVSAAAFDRTLTINGVSKSYAMTGWRIGFAGGPKVLIAAMCVLQSHSTSNAATISQMATLAALKGSRECVTEMRAAFDARRKVMVERLNAIKGVECAVPKGAFYAFPRISSLYGKGGVTGSVDFCKRLLDEKAVALIPGAAFGADDFVRLSYAVSMETIEKGCARIAEFIGGLRG